MSRGDRREPIFLSRSDRLLFLDTLAEACGKTDWCVHALCLMENHFHIVLETPKANLVYGMKWLLGTYTIRFNLRHQLTGHLFSGRYKALIIDGTSPGYFRTACEYVHLNPVRANLVRSGEPLCAYTWSSYPEYLKSPTTRWKWLRVDRLFGEMGLEDNRIKRKAFERYMETRRRKNASDEDWHNIRRGWFYGSDETKKALLTQSIKQPGRHHYGAERRESDIAKAERFVSQELAQRGWTKSDLIKRRKGDAEKVKIARVLRRDTTMTLSWIAKKLHMGSWSYTSNLLRNSK